MNAVTVTIGIPLSALNLSMPGAMSPGVVTLPGVLNPVDVGIGWVTDALELWITDEGAVWRM